MDSADMAGIDVRVPVLRFLSEVERPEALPLLAATGNGDRLWAGRKLPGSYNVKDGSAILFDVRGGTEHYSGGVQNPSFQFLCYAATEAEATALAALLYDALHKRRGAQITYAKREQIEQLLVDPTTDWPVALVYYTVRVRSPR
jgi:hypothetical protein